MNETVKLNVTSSIGFLIGMGAWSISFITLIWGYLFYRLRAGQWLGYYIDETIYIKIAVNTGLLVLSSWLLHRCLGNRRLVVGVGGFLAGILFLVGQWSLWQALMGRGLSFRGSLAGNFLYLLTGFHAVHVVVGLIVLLVFSLKLFSGPGGFRDDQRFYFALKFWDLLLFFWLSLVVLIFILK